MSDLVYRNKNTNFSQWDNTYIADVAQILDNILVVTSKAAGYYYVDRCTGGYIVLFLDYECNRVSCV